LNRATGSYRGVLSLFPSLLLAIIIWAGPVSASVETDEFQVQILIGNAVSRIGHPVVLSHSRAANSGLLVVDSVASLTSERTVNSEPTVNIERRRREESVVISGASSRFRIVGRLDRPKRIFIQLPVESAKGSLTVDVYLEPSSDITIYVRRDSVTGEVDSVITGSASQEIYESYLSLLGGEQWEFDRKLSATARTNQAHELLNLAQEHPRHPVTLDVLGGYILRVQDAVKVPIDLIYNMRELLLGSFGSTEVPVYLGDEPYVALAAALKERVQEIERRQPGILFPDYSGLSPAGETLSIKKDGAAITLVVVWASYCTWCRVHNPHLLELYSRYGRAGLHLVMWSQDEQSASKYWQRAIRDDGIENLRNISQLNGLENELSTRFGINGLPENFLLDSDGRIIANNLFEEELASRLEELFGF